MSTIAEIEAAIEKLPPDEFAQIAAWINARQARELEGGDFRKAMDKVFHAERCQVLLVPARYF